MTENGCTADSLLDFPENGLMNEKLHCRYTVESAEKSAMFRLWRTREDLAALLAEAETTGVTRAIGLWQELG